MTSADRQSFWQKHISSWQSSNESQKAYCQTHGLTLASFGYWRRRLSTDKPSANKLIPVRISSPSCLIHVRLPGGVELDVPVAVLEEVLPVLARLVSERA